jgi:5-formyltetrahydrofolate cyclo-ligase
LRRRGKQLYLPVVPPLPRRRLEFAAFLPGGCWRNNRFGIAEPSHTQRVQAHRLDLVLTPLVGYTPLGARLGMGGGFYDRSFAYRHSRRTQQPRLLGVGFSCQQCAQLPQAPWDVRLDGWVNEHELCRLS